MKTLLASSTKGAQFFLIFCAIGSAVAMYSHGFDVTALSLIVLGYFLYGCLGIVVTFHRQLTHQSYQTSSILTKVLSIFGCLAGTGSALAWVAIHINHHLKSDKPGDPHSPLYKGFRIFSLDYETDVGADTKWRMRHLIVDRYQQALHRYYFVILGAWSLVLYIIGGLYLVAFLHWMPVVITAVMSNVVNYVGHKPSWWGGYRTFNLNDQSANNWLWAIPSWGESWHNNHHRYPKNYTTALGRQIDISGLIIRLIKK
jgi:stearoyl-CoA desaturase (delta-9 desaturase)